MEGLGKSFIVLSCTLAVSWAFVHQLGSEVVVNERVGLERIEKIPHKMGEWQGTDVSMGEAVYDTLQTRSIIHRSYQDPAGQTVFLSLVYYPEARVDFHDPEACLGGQGVEMKATNETIAFVSQGKQIRIGVRRLVSIREGNESLVYYFYKSGQFFGQSYIRLRWDVALNKLGNRETSGTLVRVSSPVFPGDGDQAAECLLSFLQALYPYLNRHL